MASVNFQIVDEESLQRVIRDGTFCIARGVTD
jgi:hypothetical protein